MLPCTPSLNPAPNQPPPSQALDELQTHLLLKRVIKEKGLKPSPPSAQDSAGAPGALPGLPAPTSPAPAPAAAAGGPAQAVLSAEDVQAVADAYGQERAYLVKCQHLILKTACKCACWLVGCNQAAAASCTNAQHSVISRLGAQAAQPC